MNKKGPIIVFIIIALLAVVAYFGKDYFDDYQKTSTSDASGTSESIRWAGDGYLGYSFLHTTEMKKQLARKRYSLKYDNDGGDYATRLKKFANKEYDFIVLPINSYIEHGMGHKFPGVIVSGICESKGADAIVGFDDVLPNGKINDLNNPDLKIFYTPSSPSSFLLDLTIADFDLVELEEFDGWRIEANGSEEVYEMAEKALKNRSLGDAFVMWEPEVSKAISKLGMKKIWGSDKFGGYIIDVVVFHRDYVSKNPEAVKYFLATYFRVLDFYASRKQEMIEEFSDISKIDEDIVEDMVQNIDWYNFNENCTNLFDIPITVGIPASDGIINSIYACNNVMRRANTLDEDVEDPYLLINSTFLEELKNENLKSVGGSKGEEISFNFMNDSEWEQLQEVGTMRVKPITFQSGTSILDYQGEEIVDKVATMLVNNYPNYRVIIKGHTGKGDESANLKLSKERAEIVKQRLIAVHGIDPDRLQAKGYGATYPPTQKSGENIRSYYLRWARVEFVLVDNQSL